MRFATQCIHAGQEPDPATGAVITPAYLTSTYHQPRLGETRGFEYTRTGNPTRLALEENVRLLEGGARGFAFASGMAAIDAVLRLLRPGEHCIVSRDVYGGTYRLFERVLADYGLRFSWIDTSDLSLVEASWQPETRMVFVETPTNPTMCLTDLAAAARLTHDRGAILVVDNTFATPYLQRPLELGADLVVHSLTKYLNGHSDVVGGLVVTRDPASAERIAFVQNAAGAVLSPFDAWLVLRGTKTLVPRMQAHCANARALAEFLAAQPAVRKVYYPGLPSHPQHDLARRQMRDFGGMISIDLGGRAPAVALLERLRVFTLAESLGGVESLACHPVTMTHASVPPEMRATLGITDGLVRLSVGIEDLDDLRADLAAALGEVPPAVRRA